MSLQHVCLTPLAPGHIYSNCLVISFILLENVKQMTQQEVMAESDKSEWNN